MAVGCIGGAEGEAVVERMEPEHSAKQYSAILVEQPQTWVVGEQGYILESKMGYEMECKQPLYTSLYLV